MYSIDAQLLNKVLEILEKYPLCDRCLGRLFASLGRGWDNSERGKALKMVALMELHRRVKEGIENVDKLRIVSMHCGSIAEKLLRELKYLQDIDLIPCYICKSTIDELIERYTNLAIEKLKELKVEKFLIGVKPPKYIAKTEKELAESMGIQYWESVRSEFKRVIGKKVQEITGLRVDFENPEVIIVLDMENDEISVIIPSILIRGRYWKIGRRISQSKWIKKNGTKKYPLSLEEVLELALPLTKAERAIIHAAGREDVDVRMLGSGRPTIFEYYKPLKRDINLKELERIVNSNPWVKVSFEAIARREHVKSYKTMAARGFKIYRALILVENDVSEEELEILEKKFHNAIIHQWTPKRVLHRRKNVLRTKLVHEIKVRKITSHIIETLIKCEGGLYVRELISGDDGRTSPSFTSILNKPAKCIELDVIYVHEVL